MWFLCICQRPHANATDPAWNKKCQLAQKDNNCSLVRVTLRCGLLFASDVIAGQSQQAVREALQMTMMHGGDGSLFQGLRRQCTASHGTSYLNQRSDYYLDGSNKDDSVLPKKDQKVTSLYLLIFLPSIEKQFGSITSPVRLTFCLRVGRTEGLLFYQFAYHPNIYMCNHNCTAWEGKHTRLGCKIAAL